MAKEESALDIEPGPKLRYLWLKTSRVTEYWRSARKAIQESKVQRENVGHLLKQHQGQRKHRTSVEGLSNIKDNLLKEKNNKKMLEKQKRGVVWGEWQKKSFMTAVWGRTSFKSFQGLQQQLF